MAASASIHMLKSRDAKRIHFQHMRAPVGHLCRVECVFKLLDIGGQGSIDADACLNGCLRLRGHARTLDVLVMIASCLGRHSEESAGQRVALEGTLPHSSVGYSCRGRQLSAGCTGALSDGHRSLHSLLPGWLK